MATTELRKIILPNGDEATFVDAVARAAAAIGITLVKVETLPTAAVETKGVIYLVPNNSSEDNNIYDEYVTVEDEVEGNKIYEWELLGTTETDLSGYSETTHTHDVTLNVTANDISYTPLGTVAAPTISVKDDENTATELYSVANDGSYTAPVLTAGTTPHTYNFAIADGTLTISDTEGTAPSLTDGAVQFPTRTKVTVSAAAPIFTGTEATITPTLTNNTATITSTAASDNV